ncbi:glycosyl hydrolases family 31-domain-containing protein [Polychytrium aggregatum]|uniref:glycosyl hydrolases family 31-domain-containing protein n=1 Tax=Polychytrium aggregatum TaxID=110093 RepID=UPI0022FE68F7|nr:glycosyl hydrolases family 31-domain-containing protein [Polychytrium aggregatum]KAI9204987.1 glycosyl hydrolases family 31-domain-containing protein [Polychytrium aggregatum]
MKQVIPGNFGLAADPDPGKLVFSNPEGSVVTVQVLDHHLVRVTHFPPTSRADSSSPTFVVNGLPVPQAGASVKSSRTAPGLPRTQLGDLFPCPKPTRHEAAIVSGRTASLSTDLIRVECTLHHGDLTLRWFDLSRSGGDTPFLEDLAFRGYPFERSLDGGVYHYTKRNPIHRYFGLGEHSGPLALNGKRFRLEDMDALGYNAESTDPLYKVCPFYITMLLDHDQQARTPHQDPFAFGLYYDNLSAGAIDFGSEIDAFWGSYNVYRSDYGPLDYYVISGAAHSAAPTQPALQNVVERYAQLVGRPALIPRFALGYLASSMGYADAENAQALLEDFPRKCQEHDIPCDLMHLSSGYTVSPSDGCRNVFTWNNRRFPGPRGMVQTMLKHGIRIAANVKPWFLKNHPDYQSGKESGAYITHHSGSGPAETRLWSSGAGDSGLGSYFDFTSKGALDIWKAGVRSLLDLGIVGIWNDNNEFALPDDGDYVALRAGGSADRRLTVGETGRPLQTLLMAAASFEAMVEHAPSRRPFLITRSSCPGVQRYAVQTWSGDNATSWHTLKHNIPMGLSCGLSALPMGYGHDVGGFCGPQPGPELLVRWVQNGIFHPRFCIHSWKQEGVTEPWMYPEVTHIIRDAIRFRYRLIPYLYSLHVETHKTGRPVIRPLIFDFAQDPSCWDESFNFMLGPALLVSSVCTEGQRESSVYLPRLEHGQVWFDVWSGKTYASGTNAVVQVPLEQHGALFARSGSLVPLGRVTRPIQVEQDTERTVWIFPSPEADTSFGEFTLVEDDGESIDAPSTVLKLWFKAQGTVVEVGWDVVESKFKVAFDTIWFVLPAGDTRTLVAHKSLETIGRKTDDQHRAAIGLALKM